MMAEIRARKLSLLVAFASMAFSASGLTVGVSPAEGRAFAPPPEGVISPIGFLVSGCMNALFQAGHIATDAAASRLPKEQWESTDFGLAAAKAGLVDYLVALYVEWEPSSYNKKAYLPAFVHYRLLRVLDGAIVAKGSVRGPPDSENVSSYTARTASQAGGSAIELCLRVLSTLGMGGEK